MLLIDTFSITFIIKLSQRDYIPIQFYSTKLKDYGPLFLGDIIIPNRILQIDPQVPVSIDINYAINSKKREFVLPLTYEKENDTWCFFCAKTIIKYEVYKLEFPFSLSVEITINNKPPTKKQIQINNDSNKIILPSGSLITAKILESNYLIGVSNTQPEFTLDLTAIHGKSIKKIRLTSTSQQAFISGKQGACLCINEISLRAGDLAENIVINKLSTLSTYDGFFFGGTRIKTSTGFLPIEAIKKGSKLVNQRNRLIEVLSVNSWVSLWEEGLVYKKSKICKTGEETEELIEFFHKDTKTLCPDGVLRPISSQQLPLATKAMVCDNSDVCMCYSLTLNSKTDKIILTDDKAADNIWTDKPPKQLFINIYPRKYIRDL